MRILAIETSCDETAVSVLECNGTAEQPTVSVLGTGLYSQISTHAQYGGVFPALAKREHQLNLVPMLTVALKELNEPSRIAEKTHDTAQLTNILAREEELLKHLLHYLAEHPENPGIDAIAVTQGPGLEPALWVGLNFAKALSYAWQVPLIPVNHMEGHVVSILTEQPHVQFPALALLVSGGHTELQLVHTWGTYELLGQTRDDAVGEAFDKVARLLGLPYPGGPALSGLAQEAREQGERAPFAFPRPMLHANNYDFSFAGLKTAVLYKTRELGALSQQQKREIAREFEDAVTDVLLAKTRTALTNTNAQTLIIGGGVSANTYLREQLTAMLADAFPNTTLLLPTRELSTDNAVMIGIAGYIAYTKNPTACEIFTPDTILRADGTLRLS